MIRRKKHGMKRRRHETKAARDHRQKNKLLNKGWEVVVEEGFWSVGEKEIPVEIELFSHPTLGEKLTLDAAKVVQRNHEEHLKETFDERTAEYLKEKGWTLDEERDVWHKPNWDMYYEEKQKREFEKLSFDMPTGCYATLRQAYHIQRKLDVEESSEDQEQSLEDMMLMSQSKDFGS